MLNIIWACFFLLSLILPPCYASDNLPLRGTYPNVKTMSNDRLNSDFKDVIVIDVRSKLEFDIAHINNAHHISMSTLAFVKLLERVRSKVSSKALVFYCNGQTCAKSYKAYIRAFEAGFSNIYSFDAGIFDWINAHPEKSTLMNESPANTKKIIAQGQLETHLVTLKDFINKAKDGANIIDIREPFQRKVTLGLSATRNIPLDKLLPSLKNKVFIDSPIIIMDAVGKQIRWLQYHLQEHGYSEYYFLENGVEGVDEQYIPPRTLTP